MLSQGDYDRLCAHLQAGDTAELKRHVEDIIRKFKVTRFMAFPFRSERYAPTVSKTSSKNCSIGKKSI